MLGSASLATAKDFENKCLSTAEINYHISNFKGLVCDTVKGKVLSGSLTKTCIALHLASSISREALHDCLKEQLIEEELKDN